MQLPGKDFTEWTGRVMFDPFLAEITVGNCVCSVVISVFPRPPLIEGEEGGGQRGRHAHQEVQAELRTDGRSVHR